MASWTDQGLEPSKNSDVAIPLHCIVGVYTNVDRAIRALLASIEGYQGPYDQYLDLEKAEELLNEPNERGRIAAIKTKDKMYWLEVVAIEVDEEDSVEQLPLYHRICLYDMWSEEHFVKMQDKKVKRPRNGKGKYRTW